MTIKPQNIRKLELEERLIRINIVLNHLTEEIKKMGHATWQIEDLMEKADDGFDVVVVDGTGFYYEDYDSIKNETMKVLTKIANSGQMGKGDKSIDQEWEYLVPIAQEADRLSKRSRLIDRKFNLEQEKERLISILERATEKSENRTKKGFEHKRIKILVNNYMENHKGCTVEQAILTISFQENKEFEATKRLYYYKGKK